MSNEMAIGCYSDQIAVSFGGRYCSMYRRFNSIHVFKEMITISYELGEIYN
jgi:transcriptional regulator NrdR family protein